LLPEILPTLINDGWEIEIDDQREYETNFDLDTVDQNTFSHVMWPKDHPVEGQPVVLRDYQIEIVNDFLKNPQCLQEIATGAGKTLITATLSQRIESHGRSIVIVPNKSLVVQTEEDYINMQLDVGVFFGDRKELGKQHTICTWQSLNSLMKNTKAGKGNYTISEFLEGVVCVMVDEVHSAKADALKTLLTGPMARIPLRWGLTGTVPKEDFEFQSLHVSLGKVISKVSAKELQDKGVLANCHVNIVQLIDHAEHTNYQSELKYLLTNPDRLDIMANLINEANKTGNTLVLVDRVEAGKELVSRLGDNAVFVSGATKNSDRKEQYDEVANSNNKIIVATYGVAAVGINIPRIFNLMLIEPGKSFVRVIQSIGRGIRKAEDKENVQIWDITSTCKFAKRHLTKRKKFYKEANYPFSIEKLNWK
jgi:superfamily II DNA or RNA helicase